ncbi:hypothetical protein [Leuconostoc carnosum]|uniref:hypothetical protein n=1 Tax=Leuconostoc carnosum TaxID=1252 RepID=UPI00123ABC76|nr:hypothetical protein [Leuconostoc carnosum]KAA8371914.1 hypothetical protein FE415_07500 [Leuconostoc carnosum]KAA8375272.1 hypothetical protein FE408_07250 [Leuconostoc carnosum]
MTEPVAYMWKTERGTIIGFTPNDNSHSGGQLGIPLYTAEQLHPMKWFVRSKERDNDGDYAFLTGIVNTNDWIYSKQHDDVIGIYPFDTKEEAELWTNPLTEAVQLPVEDE